MSRARVTGPRAAGRRAPASDTGDDTTPLHAFSSAWPHPVLLRNHLLSGTLNRSVDRQEAARLRGLDPGIDARARAIEVRRGGVLQALAEDGLVEQVLDLSTGVPAAGVVRCAHVALADDDSPVPVVYVATDGHLAVATETAIYGYPHTGMLVGDPCDARTLWRAVTSPGEKHPRRLLHPSRPVVLDASTISDLVPDPRRLYAVLRAWRTTVRDGSVLLLARSLDPAVPDPLATARRAGWHPLPVTTAPTSDTGDVVDQRAQIAVLTTRKRRRPRRRP
ncbi:SAM-dependent methyltransferase [Saccharothrix isguenensis]